MTETITERLGRIKSEARLKELGTSTGPRPVVFIEPADYDWLIQQANRAEKLEADLKGTITKKNRQHKDTLKRLKKAEWEAMIHKSNHGRIYTELFQLRESLKRGGKDA